MSDHESDENWLVNGPVMAQWLDEEMRKPRYLGFSSPANWRSHLVLNLGLDMRDSKREALFWFRLPIRVKSKSAKRPTKFYVYFIIELDMFDVNGEDQALSFSQLSVPPPVQFAFKSSNVCQSDDEIVRLRFNLKRPGVVVMPRAEESPFEPSVVNQEVLLALKSLSKATKFSVYLHQKSVPTNRLQTLCWMVQHGDLQSRPRELNTLYHGKGGQVNAWQNFNLPLDQAAVDGPSGGNKPESFFEQKSFSFPGGFEGATKAASADKSLSSEKQAMLAEMEEQPVVESVEREDHPQTVQQNEDQVGERRSSVPPAYDQAVSSVPRANIDVAPKSRPSLRTAHSLSFNSADRDAPPERTRQSSAPPAYQQGGRHQIPSTPLETLPEAVARGIDPTTSELPSETAPPPPYKRPKPPSDDEIDDDDDDDAVSPRPTSKDIKHRPHRSSSKSSSSRRPHKQVRFDPSTTTTSARPSSSTTTAPTTKTPPLLPPSLTDAALALPTPQSTLLRATIDWFKWAWTATANPRAHVALTRPHLLELGHRARVGDEAGFYRVRARCSARVLFALDEDDDGEKERGRGRGRREKGGALSLLGELEELLVWMAREVDPAAERAVTGELREVGRLARGGERIAFAHGCAVCAGFVVFWFGREMGEGEVV